MPTVATVLMVIETFIVEHQNNRHTRIEKLNKNNNGDRKNERVGE